MPLCARVMLTLGKFVLAQQLGGAVPVKHGKTCAFLKPSRIKDGVRRGVRMKNGARDPVEVAHWPLSPAAFYAHFIGNAKNGAANDPHA